MKISILAVIILSVTFNCYANLYHCKDASSTPERSDNSKVLKVSLHLKDSVWLQNTESEEIKENKKLPFLIYYAIDSEEPFMKFATYYEVAKMNQSCKESKFVNFAVVLNSVYKQKNQFFICKNKIAKWIDIKSYPELDQKLKNKLKEIKTGNNDKFNPAFRYRVRFKESTNIPFSEFPLAHPDFMYDILDKIISDKKLFPGTKYIPTLHLKSHGSNETVLSGLYSCQIQAKIKSQLDTLNELFTPAEIEQMNNFDPYNCSQIDLFRFESLISKMNLGVLPQERSNSYLNSADGERALGNYNLGNYNLGNFNLSNSFDVNSVSSLGSSFSGLGAYDGLGTENAFGLDHMTLNTVLDDLFDIKKNRKLAFLMLESCDTNRDSTFEYRFVQNLHGFYSANHSLWYRNLNWWTLLERSSGSLLKLVNDLNVQTNKIINIEVKELQ